jgi:hypothetical protein
LDNFPYGTVPPVTQAVLDAQGTGGVSGERDNPGISHDTQAGYLFQGQVQPESRNRIRGFARNLPALGSLLVLAGGTTNRFRG